MAALSERLQNAYETYLSRYNVRYNRLPLTRTVSSDGSDSSQSSFGSRTKEALLETKEALVEWLPSRHGISEKVARRRTVLLLAMAVSTMGICIFIIQAELRHISARVARNPQYDLGVVFEGTETMSVQTLEESCPIHSLNESEWFLHPARSTLHNRPSHIPEHRPLRKLSSQTDMSQACADLWISKGEVCQEIQVGTGLGDVSIDAVWTDVEQSKHWREWKAAYTASEITGARDVEAEGNHFRSHDEMRYSLRSAWRNLPFARRFFLLSTVLPVDSPPADVTALANDLSAVSCLAAQIPDWLDTSKVKLTPGPDNDSRLEVLSHWDLWQTYASNATELEDWKNKGLPTFNSHSIESQLANLPNVAEHLLYFNNDFYAGRPFAPADIGTKLFGQVYRTYAGSWVEGARSAEEAMLIDGEGNARVMPETVRLLDERFGRRSRNYPAHVMYGMATPLLEEVTSIWAEEAKQTATVRFRGRGAEYWIPYLAMYYNIGKQREALLWSFLIARSDVDGSNTYSREERSAMLAAIGGERDGDDIRIRRPHRSSSLEKPLELLDQAGIARPNHTTYGWTSLDGYIHVQGDGGPPVYPDYREGDFEAPNTFCSLNIPRCFGSSDFFDKDAPYEELRRSSTDIFKHLAFEEPTCGDCLMAALLGQSGPAGFEAFLPPPSSSPRQSTTRDTAQEAVPYVGGWAKRWQEADFAKANNLLLEDGRQRWDARDFAVRLIQRYSYVIGDSPAPFIELTDDIDYMGWILWRMEEDKSPLMAINDRLSGTNATITAQADKKFRDFQARMWPDPSPFERVQ